MGWSCWCYKGATFETSEECRREQESAKPVAWRWIPGVLMAASVGAFCVLNTGIFVVDKVIVNNVAITTTTTTAFQDGLVPTSVRVSKALGSRGYDKLRVSIVSTMTNGSSECDPAQDWDYCDKFQQCDQNGARQFHLRSSLIDVVPGEKTSLTLGGQDVELYVPPSTEGSVGLLIGDPCIYQNNWCAYADVYDMKGTLQRVMNGLSNHDELDYWMNVGDLFYDIEGGATQDFFAGLLPKTAARPHHIVMGNHDFWLNGMDGAATDEDSFGNFHMQWYAQDAMSSKEDPATPFDFSEKASEKKIAAMSNFQWYTQIGNVAFVGFSNVYEWDAQTPFFEEVCSWAGAQKPALLVLLGHWHAVDMGCAPGMDGPGSYNHIKSLPGCAELGTRIKYFEGHRHCNGVQSDNTGFLIGSFGMGIGGCADPWNAEYGDGAFGLPILDTRGEDARLYYVELGRHGQRNDHFEDTLGCIEAKGFSECMEQFQATDVLRTWMSEAIPRSLKSNSSVSISI